MRKLLLITSVLIILSVFAFHVSGETNPKSHSFELKLDCPEGQDCKKLLEGHLESLKDEGIHVRVEPLKGAKDDL